MRGILTRVGLVLVAATLALGMAACKGKDDAAKGGKGEKAGSAMGPTCQKYDKELAEVCKDAKGVRKQGCDNTAPGWERTKKSINAKNSKNFEEMCQGFIDNSLKGIKELKNE